MTSHHKAAGGKRGRIISESEFRRMWADMSLSVTAIGQSIGITANAVKQRAQIRGLPPRPRGRPWTRTHDHGRMVALYNAGLSMTAVAAALGCTYHNVFMALRRAGINARHRKDPYTTNCVMRAAMAASARIEQAAIINAEMADKNRDNHITGSRHARGAA